MPALAEPAASAATTAIPAMKRRNVNIEPPFGRTRVPPDRRTYEPRRRADSRQTYRVPRSGRARWPNRSSKPVRRRNPPVGQFDSGAAPSARSAEAARRLAQPREVARCAFGFVERGVVVMATEPVTDEFEI